MFGIFALLSGLILGVGLMAGPAPAEKHQPPSPTALKMLARFEALWADSAGLQAEVASIREQNPEWDFMHRTFLVLAASNMALADPGLAARAIKLMDDVIEDTLEQERVHGVNHFLMGYATASPWVVQPPRSMFVDGEIVLMLAARRLVAESETHRKLFLERVRLIDERMKQNQYRFAESYPNECWLFCNAIALAATEIADRMDGTDHKELVKEWLKSARAKLVDKSTGMLISAYNLDGNPTSSGTVPEGSSIWLVAHMLQLVDPGLAKEQYDLARNALGRALMGMGYSLEWPTESGLLPDIDSGGVVPGIGASTSASGLAMIASRAFCDSDFHAALVRSLDAVGQPREVDGKLAYGASNLVGDAVILYGLTNGPLWSKIKALKYSRHSDK